VLCTNFSEITVPGQYQGNHAAIQQSLANAAGQTGLTSIGWDEGPVPSPGKMAPNRYTIYNILDVPTYVMIDFAPPNLTSPVVSERLIVANETYCFSYPVTSGGDGNTTDITYLDGNSSQKLSVGVTKPGITTFITSDVYCGARCSNLQIFQSRDPQGDTNAATLFSCNVTLGQVSNTVDDSQLIPDYLAKDITSGISGSTGFQSSEATPNSASYDTE
jgi:hypothetical protein